MTLVVVTHSHEVAERSERLIRMRDGRVVSDVYLFQVKTPEESKNDWDVYKVRKVIPPEQAWRPMSAGGCPLVKT